MCMYVCAYVFNALAVYSAMSWCCIKRCAYTHIQTPLLFSIPSFLTIPPQVDHIQLTVRERKGRNGKEEEERKKKKAAAATDHSSYLPFVVSITPYSLTPPLFCGPHIWSPRIAFSISPKHVCVCICVYM